MAVNTRAPMIVAQEYARERIAAGKTGAIVNVSSVASFIGIPDHAAYCASKGGLDGLTRVMAKELAPKGIRVNAVNPTVTLTPMAVKAWSDPEKAAGMLNRIPVGRFAESADVAEVVLFLLSWQNCSTFLRSQSSPRTRHKYIYGIVGDSEWISLVNDQAKARRT